MLVDTYNPKPISLATRPLEQLSTGNSKLGRSPAVTPSHDVPPQYGLIEWPRLRQNFAHELQLVKGIQAGQNRRSAANLNHRETLWAQRKSVPDENLPAQDNDLTGTWHPPKVLPRE